MATKRYLYDSGYKCIGYIEIDGDKHRLYNAGSTFLGQYIVSEDKTYNSGYTFIGYGNILATLLR